MEQSQFPLAYGTVPPKPATAADRSKDYNQLVGASIAGIDVGLFYQLNQDAGDATSNQKEIDSRRFPIEAGGVNT